jgi:hypothetical protein
VAEFSGPWASIPLPDDRYQRLQHWQSAGRVETTASENPTINADATGLTIHPCEVWARGRYWRIDATRTMIPAAPDTNPRTDRLVIRFDPAGQKAYPWIIKGAPHATSRVAPAMADSFSGMFDQHFATFEVWPTAPTVRALEYPVADPGLGIAPVLPGKYPASPLRGQTVYEMHNRRLLVWDSIEGWNDLVSSGRYWYTRRAENSLHDDYAAGDFRSLMTWTVNNAPAGYYRLDYTLVLQTQAAGTSAGTHRLSIAHAAGPLLAERDLRTDIDGIARAQSYTWPFRHSPAANVTFDIAHNITSGPSGRVYNDSNMTLTYLGRTP